MIYIHPSNKLPRSMLETPPGLCRHQPIQKEGSTTMSLIAYLGLVVIAGPIVALSVFAGIYNAIEGMWK